MPVQALRNLAFAGGVVAVCLLLTGTGPDAGGVVFFHTFKYLAFFLTVFTVYWALPWKEARVRFLVGASFFFYYQWSQQLAFLVTTTTILDYAFGRAIEASQSQRRKKAYLIASLVMNLGVLGYFKYMNFFLGALRAGLPESWTASGAFDALDIIVPFGISFYTFEAISYVVDVYRGRIRAERRLSHFMLFILFFPHLVSGPIVRAGDFLPQTYRPKRFNWVRVRVGLEFFLVGLVKKMAIADRVALFCDPVFANPEQFSTGEVWLGVLAFAVRIYCDFSGYSDMAVGSAHMLGYKLTLNFRLPYMAVNVSDFWRRWHISLSTWLRDYVFIPLGGSRGSRWGAARNLMITMALGGLWHGASWSFLIWGLLHGALLVGHRLFREFAEARPLIADTLKTWPGTLFRVSLTFFCVMMCWVFFQPSLDVSMTMFQRMFGSYGGVPHPEIPHYRCFWYLFAVLVIGHVMVSRRFWERYGSKAPPWLQGFWYALALHVALVLAVGEGQGFIYFVF